MASQGDMATSSTSWLAALEADDCTAAEQYAALGSPGIDMKSLAPSSTTMDPASPLVTTSANEASSPEQGKQHGRIRKSK